MTSFTARLLAACGGFLLAVLWMDLMFDVQALARGKAGGPVPEEAIAAIAMYYRRVTTDAFPMNRLIGAVMIVAIAAGAVQLFAGAGALPFRLLELALLGAPIGLALFRIFPDAVELGSGSGARERRVALARRICWAHLGCFASILGFTIIELCAAWS